MKESAAPAASAAESSGYAEAAEGLEVYYEVRGKGEPIVVLAGGLMDINSMAQVISPLADSRQVIGIDLEGHGKTGLRKTPMTHERLGDDVAAVLRHLKIAKADVAGYSHGGAAALRMAIQHPDMVRNLILMSTPFERDGWYPSTLQGMRAVNANMADQMKSTPIFKNYGKPDQFPIFLDRMGELLRKDYDWRTEAQALKMPVLLVYATMMRFRWTTSRTFLPYMAVAIRIRVFRRPNMPGRVSRSSPAIRITTWGRGRIWLR